jgi:uncharacterized protein (TIGR03435 family)
MRHAVIALLLLFGGQQAAPKPSFEVASIKRSALLDPNGTLGFQQGGRFRAVNFDGRTLIAIAHRTGQRLLPSQIIGAPDWLYAERYDITAKVSDELAASSPRDLFARMPLLLQSLLEDRFKLKLHHETRELPVYALVLARKDGSFGPRFRKSTVDCADLTGCRIESVPGHLTAGRITLETLTTLLAGTVDRFVVDRTGLSGTFDLELEWSPDQSAPDKPSIFAAVQEQLGLKFESQRGPVEVVVIDHVERPTED